MTRINWVIGYWVIERVPSGREITQYPITQSTIHT